jgi:pantetheine hydrolase
MRNFTIFIFVFTFSGINSRENLSLVAVDLQSTEVPDISECDYSHDSVSISRSFVSVSLSFVSSLSLQLFSIYAFQILSELSFAVENASIYVLVNVVEVEACNESEACPPDGFKLFNTNLVFNRRGCIVSRYRKFNLLVEPNMNVTKQPEVATFETDFGVTFGHFVSFDILFKSPAMDIVNMNVKHILYPTMWYSQIPFLTSVQIQQAFAQRNNIILLSAGTNSPLKSNTGSGIFVGKHGAVEKIVSWRNETRMIIAEVPKDIDDADYEPKEPEVSPYTPNEMNALKLWNFSPKSSHPLQEHFVSTIGDVTCEFSLNYTKLEVSNGTVGFGYRLVAFKGHRKFGGIASGGEVYCAIVDEDDENTCMRKVHKSESSVEFHSIDIKLTIDDEDFENFLVMPTTLDTSILPLSTASYVYDHEKFQGKQKYEMKSTQSLDNLITFGIFGRIFALDGKESEEIEEEISSEVQEVEEERVRNRSNNHNDDNELSLKMIIYVVLMIFLSIVTAIMTYRKLQQPYIKPDLNKRRKSSM